MDKKKFKLFTNTGLDGIASNIIIRASDWESDIENLDDEVTNNRIKEFIQNEDYIDYDWVLIVDLSINKEVAELIDGLEYNSFGLLNHQSSALWLNRYLWAVVQDSLDNISLNHKTNGSELFYYFILDHLLFDTLNDFITQINMYVTNSWNNTNNTTPKLLNDLFFILGKDIFINEIEICNYNVSDFINKHKLLLEGGV